MATNRYSLADYTLEIILPSNNRIGIQNFFIGGPGENGYEGSFLDSITVRRSTDTWSTEGDATGSWVHSKNLNRTGTVDLSLNQISDMVLKLVYIFLAYEKEQDILGGMDITIHKNNEIIAECHDCYIQGLPEQVLGESAAAQTWTFTCGRVALYPYVSLGDF